jgi:hypothetical protein
MQPTPSVQRGARIVFMVLAAVAVFFLSPLALRWLNPEAGSFDVGTLNAPILAALQFFAAVSMAFVAWRFLFPGLYGYVRDCMEGKLLENLTEDLKLYLNSEDVNIMLAAEKRHIAQFQFIIRCTRFVLALFPFVFFLVLAMRFVNTALTVVPH